MAQWMKNTHGTFTYYFFERRNIYVLLLLLFFWETAHLRIIFFLRDGTFTYYFFWETAYIRIIVSGRRHIYVLLFFFLKDGAFAYYLFGRRCIYIFFFGRRHIYVLFFCVDYSRRRAKDWIYFLCLFIQEVS